MADARHHGESRLAITVATPDGGSHWVAACGVVSPLVCDSLNGGRWVRFDAEGPHADAPVATAWLVERR
jgi:hypothetical protein